MSAYSHFIATSIAEWLDDPTTRESLTKDLVLNGSEVSYTKPATHAYEMDVANTKLIVLAQEETHVVAGSNSRIERVGSAAINIIVSYIPMSTATDTILFERAQRLFGILIARLKYLLEEKQSFIYTDPDGGTIRAQLEGQVPLRIMDYSAISDVDEVLTIFAAMISFEMEFGFAGLNPIDMIEIS